MDYGTQGYESDPAYEVETVASEPERVEAILRELVELLKRRAEGRMDAEEPRFTELRRDLLQTPYLSQQGRDFLKQHRSLQQFWERTARSFSSYAERRTLVDDAFDSTFTSLEEGLTSLVQFDEDALHGLEMGEASRIWDKAKKRLTEDDDSDGALTLTRTLLETVCKKILDAYGVTYSGGDALQSLCKKALTEVVPAGISGREHFQHFMRSMLNMVEHIALYRAEESDAHGSPIEKALQMHQAAYAVNLAGSSAIFLIECYRTAQERAASQKL